MIYSPRFEAHLNDAFNGRSTCDGGHTGCIATLPRSDAPAWRHFLVGKAFSCFAALARSLEISADELPPFDVNWPSHCALPLRLPGIASHAAAAGLRHRVMFR